MAGTAFEPTTSLTDVDLGAKDYRLIEITNTSGWSGNETNLPKSVRFQYSFGTNEYLNPSESFFMLRLRVTDAGGEDLETADNIALSRFATHMLWDKITTRLANTQIEELTYPGQQAVFAYLNTKSQAWLNTFGTLYLAQESFAERQELIVGDVTPEPQLSIQSGFWQTAKMIRACTNLQIDFSLNSNWATRIIESTGAAKTPGALGDYRVFIEEMLFYAAVYTPENYVPQSPSDIIEMNALEIQGAALTGVTSDSKTFGLATTAFKAFVGNWDTDAGVDTLIPISGTINGGITQVTIDCGIGRRNVYPYDLDFTAHKTQRAFYDWIMSAFADVDPSGASMTEQRWRTVNPMYAWKLIEGDDASWNHIVVNQRFAASFTGFLYLATSYVKRAVLGYSPIDGRLVRVELAISKGDLANALSSVKEAISM